MSSVQKYTSVDLKNINYSTPEKIGSSYFGSISFGSSIQPLYIQTSKVRSLTSMKDLKDTKNPYLEFEIVSGNYDLYDFFLGLDDHNIKTTVSNSKEWFKKQIPLEAIDDMYKRTTKPVKKNENPRLKIKLPVIKNKIQCGVYNQQKVFVDLNEIEVGSELILVIHIRGLKILKQYFYCDNYISQIKLFQPSDTKFNIIKEYSIVDDEEDIDENISSDIFSQEILEAMDDTFKQQQENQELQELENDYKQNMLLKEIGDNNTNEDKTELLKQHEELLKQEEAELLEKAKAFEKEEKQKQYRERIQQLEEELNSL